MKGIINRAARWDVLTKHGKRIVIADIVCEMFNISWIIIGIMSFILFGDSGLLAYIAITLIIKVYRDDKMES